MQIQEIKLTNFRCFEDKTITLYPNTYIGGDNGVGKTTLVDSFFWCFFGKSSDGRSTIDFPKPVINGEQVFNVDTEVSITVDGVEYTRKLIEKWPRKRGQAEAVFDGYKQELLIDGESMTKTKFNARISEDIGKEEEFRLLTSPTFIPSMPWAKMRDLFVGDRNDLHEKSVEVEKLKLQKKDLDKVVNDLPVQIQTTKDLAAGDDHIEFDQEKYDELQKNREELREQVVRLENPVEGEGLRKLKSEKMDVELEMRKAERLHDTEKRDRIADIEKHIDDVRAKVDADRSKAWDEYNKSLADANRELMAVRDGRASLEYDIQIEGHKLDKMRDQHKATLATTADVMEVCPTCSRAIDAGDVESAKEQFNIQKAEKLKKHVEEGKKQAEWVKSLKAKLEPYDGEVEQLSERVAIIKEGAPGSSNEKSPEEVDFLLQIASIKAEPVPQEVTDLQDKFNDLEKQIEEYKGDDDTSYNPNIIADLRDQITSISNKIFDMGQIKAEQANASKFEEKVADLQKELKAKSQELADIECQIEKTEDEIKVIIKAEEDKLNSRFTMTRFKLFHTQQNGEVKPTCIPTVDGIPYSDLNTAKKLNCGIDIVNTLMKERNKSYPVFIDNSECSNNILEPIAQAIELYVTKDKELVIKENK